MCKGLRLHGLCRQNTYFVKTIIHRFNNNKIIIIAEQKTFFVPCTSMCYVCKKCVSIYTMNT